MTIQNPLQTIDIQRILELAPAAREYALGTDLILGQVDGSQLEKSRSILNLLQYPVRFDGYVIYFLRRGSFSVELNLNQFDVRERSLLVNVPGNIIKTTYSRNPEDLARLDLYFVLTSREFMSDIRFDFTKVAQDSIRLWNNPCIILNDEALSLAEEYFYLAKRILSSDTGNKRDILRALMTSFTYVTIDLWQEQLSLSKRDESKSSARVNQIFERFIALVTEYHSSERGMAFYADKLCLTPKYLSKLVKQASGRSAPDWIDSFVILEAKNMLKYTDMAIKEIVYALHFPNQSVFYKFFKAHTGQTPSEYRKG